MPYQCHRISLVLLTLLLTFSSVEGDILAQCGEGPQPCPDKAREAENKEQAERVSIFEGYPDRVRARLEIRDRRARGLAPKSVFERALRWPAGRAVTVAFRSGNETARQRIEELANVWAALGNFSFKFKDSSGRYLEWSPSDTSYAADIRIGFIADDGYWSLVGTDSRNPSIVSPNEASMNLEGMADGNLSVNERGTVLHEFGHALGFHHEHQSPEGGCDLEFRWEDDPGYVPTLNQYGEFANDRWGRRPGIYTVLGGEPNNWSRATVDHNLRQLPDSRAYTATEHDPSSIMHYSFGDWMFVDGGDSPCRTGRNNVLSALDKRGVNAAYPTSKKLGEEKSTRDWPVVLNQLYWREEGQVKKADTSRPKSSLKPEKSVDSAAEDIKDRVREAKANLYFTSEALISKTTGEKVIYGEDNRKDIWALSETDESEKMAKLLANSTCLLTSRSRLDSIDAGAYLLDVRQYRQFGLPACSEERFRDQQVGGWCSGFLVGNDLVVTAGHCCEPTDEDVQQISFVFGFFAGSDGSTPEQLQSNQVYFGQSVIKHRLSTEGDFAIIKLDRPVTFEGAQPLKVRSAGQPAQSDRIGLIGYPSGLPAKAAFGAETKIVDTQSPTWIVTNLDAYGGNSGSAVFNHDGIVEGILVRGNTDFKVHNNTCFFSNRLEESEGGETITRSSVFSNFIIGPDAQNSEKQRVHDEGGN